MKINGVDIGAYLRNSNIAAWWRSLFPHDKAVRYVLTAFVVLLLLAAATQCRASEFSFEGGAQYLRGPAASVAAQIITQGPGDARIESGLFLIGSVDRPDRIHDGVMGVQALYVDGLWKFDLGLGVAYMNRQHENLGSSLNFAMLVRYRFTERWYVAVRHWSNAGTTPDNTGLDVVNIGYRF